METKRIHPLIRLPLQDRVVFRRKAKKYNKKLELNKDVITELKNELNKEVKKVDS